MLSGKLLGSDMKKIGVLISGRGSNLQAIIDACESGDIPAKIAVVISNDPSAFGLERAQKHEIPAVVINHKDYKDKNTYELMVDFYTNIFEGDTYSKALREAKHKLIENKATAFPANWAGFTLVGVN